MIPVVAFVRNDRGPLLHEPWAIEVSSIDVYSCKEVCVGTVFIDLDVLHTKLGLRDSRCLKKDIDIDIGSGKIKKQVNGEHEVDAEVAYGVV